MNETALRRILAKLSIEVESRSENPSGVWLLSRCPLAEWTHQKGTDNRPSFAISVNDSGVSGYFCHSCHRHGRVRALASTLGHYRGKNYGAVAIEAEIADTLRAELPAWKDSKAQQSKPIEPVDEGVFDGVFVPAWSDDKARGYLKQRGIDRETCEYLELAYDPTRSRIVFAVRDGAGTLFGYTGRSTLSNHRSPKILDYAGLPKRHLILGEHLWGKPDDEQDRRPILLVEGLFGFAHLLAINADKHFRVGAILGSAFTKEKRDRVVAWDLPTYLLFDNDEAGETATFGWDDEVGNHRQGAAEMLFQYVGVYIPVWPDGKDDPDQLTIQEVRRFRRKTLPFNP